MNTLMKKSLIQGILFALGITAFFFVLLEGFALYAGVGTDKEFVGILVVFVGSIFVLMIVIMMIGPLMRNSALKKQEKRYSLSLQNEIASLQPVEGTKMWKTSENWLVGQGLAYTEAFAKDGIASIEVVNAIQTVAPILQITTMDGKKKKLNLRSKNPAATRAALKNWFDPNATVEATESVPMEKPINAIGATVAQSDPRVKRDSKGLLITTIVVIAVVALALYGTWMLKGNTPSQPGTHGSHPGVSSSGGNDETTPLNATTFEWAMEQNQKYNTHADQATYEYFAGFCEEDPSGNPDDIRMAASATGERDNYKIQIANDSHSFWCGDIALYDANDKVILKISPFMVSPDSVVYYGDREISDGEPDTYSNSNDLFIRFTYNEPNYEYTYDWGTTDDDVFYSAYITAAENINTESFRSLAIRNYALQELGDYDDCFIYVISNDHEPVDFGTYTEYDIHDATYCAYIDLTNETVTLYDIGPDGNRIETETIDVLTEIGG